MAVLKSPRQTRIMLTYRTQAAELGGRQPGGRILWTISADDSRAQRDLVAGKILSAGNSPGRLRRDLQRGRIAGPANLS